MLSVAFPSLAAFKWSDFDVCDELIGALSELRTMHGHPGIGEQCKLAASIIYPRSGATPLLHGIFLPSGSQSAHRGMRHDLPIFFCARRSRVRALIATTQVSLKSVGCPPTQQIRPPGGSLRLHPRAASAPGKPESILHHRPWAVRLQARARA